MPNSPDPIPKVKKWCNITPTLIGSDYNRFEIISEENAQAIVVHVKKPDFTMGLSCDKCPGPHNNKNFFCSLNNGNTNPLPSPGNERIYLFELFTGRALPGSYLLEIQPTTKVRKSCIAVLWRD